MAQTLILVFAETILEWSSQGLDGAEKMEQWKEIQALSLVMSKINGMNLRWAQEHELNAYTVKVLYSLAGNEPVTQKQICMASGMPKQTVNNAIRALEKEEMVQLAVQESDKREKAVTLTEKGMQYLQDTLMPVMKFESKIIKRMGYENYEHLLQYLTCYSEAMEQEMETNL